MSLYHLLCGRKKMCLLQQWFNYSFCNRGHGCRKVLFASSIHRKEVWVFQVMIFILTGIFIPFPCLFPSCMSSLWSLSYSLWVWLVLGHISGLTSADTETNIDVIMAKCSSQSCLWGVGGLDLILQLFVDFDMDKEKFSVWALFAFNNGVAWSQAVEFLVLLRSSKGKKRNNFP